MVRNQEAMTVGGGRVWSSCGGGKRKQSGCTDRGFLEARTSVAALGWERGVEARRRETERAQPLKMASDATIDSVLLVIRLVGG